MPGFLFGRVNDDGSIGNAGSGGWTSSQLDAGKYHVQFSSAMENIPAVVVSCHADDNNTIATMDITTTYFVVHTKQAGPFENSGFNFVAVAADS